MLARARHQFSRGWGSDNSSAFRQSVAARAWRFFNPAVAWPIAAILAVGLLVAVYGLALAHAQQRYLDLRSRYCATLVETFYARNPRLRQLRLIDACLEWEQLGGEPVR